MTFLDAESSVAVAGEANLRGLVRWRRHMVRYGGAMVSGLLLSATFPPWELDWLLWVAFVPLLLVAPPASWPQRLAVGYIFGFAHFVTSLYWLNTIGFAAGVLLASLCALFPMAWYILAAALSRGIFGRHGGRGCQLPRALAPFEGRGRGYCALLILLPCVWVTQEWLRSWILTGFSWNQLGISQWQRLGLLRIVPFTGVYGISFLAVMTNLALLWVGWAWWYRIRRNRKQEISWPVVLAIILVMPVVIVGFVPFDSGPPQSYLSVAGIQGNIPQCRVWTEEQLDTSLRVYEGLTRKAVRTLSPDLVVWPETAIPAAARWNSDYVSMLRDLFPDIGTPLLLGSVDMRPAPEGASPPVDYLSFNTVLLYGRDGTIVDFYDKIHLVPFGEYVPMGEYLPWLVEWIGMGRDLVPGAEYTVFQLPGQVRAGVNICYEDAYADISRAFVLRGANVLMTLTNDAWYAESAGSRQHLTHAVFRAVENRRPLFRSGNNSDTCLILPNGDVRGLLYDPETGDRFVRRYRGYKVPVWDDAPLTFYTVYGDVFAKACALCTLVAVIVVCWRWFQVKKSLQAKMLERQSE